MSKFPKLEPILYRVLHPVRDGRLHFTRKELDRNAEAPSLAAAFKEYVMETAAQFHPDEPCLDHWRARRRLQAFVLSVETHPEIMDMHDEYPDADNGPIWTLPTVCSALSRRFPTHEPLRELTTRPSAAILIQANHGILSSCPANIINGLLSSGKLIGTVVPSFALPVSFSSTRHNCISPQNFPCVPHHCRYVSLI